MKKKNFFVPVLTSILSLGCLSLTACQNNSADSTQKTALADKSKSTVKSNGSVSKADQDQIIKLFNQMQQALIDKDINKLNELLPADFTARHITGKTQTKQEWLDDIKNGEMNYYEFSNVKYSFKKQKNNRVLLKVEQDIHAKIYGQEGTWAIPGDRTFEKVNGTWKIAD